jgi:outer membrane biosynthesis protein TonB
MIPLRVTPPSSRRSFALTAAVPAIAAGALLLPSSASAWYCPPGTHESPPDTGQCVPDTTATPAPAPVETTPAATPAPAPATPAPAPTPPPAAVPAPAPPTPATSTPASPPPLVEQQPQESKPKHETRPTQQVAGETDTSPAPAAKPVQATETHTLPFTGFDTGIVALVGVASVAGGIVLRRRVASDA